MISQSQVKQYVTKFTPMVKQTLSNKNMSISERILSVYNSISGALFKTPITELDSIIKVGIVRAIIKFIFIRIQNIVFSLFSTTRKTLSKPLFIAFEKLVEKIFDSMKKDHDPEAVEDVKKAY